MSSTTDFEPYDNHLLQRLIGTDTIVEHQKFAHLAIQVAVKSWSCSGSAEAVANMQEAGERQGQDE